MIKLFEDFIKVIQNVKINGHLIEEIKYRWANFLKKHVTSKKKENLDKDNIEKEFQKLKKEIEQLLYEKNIDNKFENKFYQMEEGISNYRTYSNELLDYFMFSVDNTNEKFYFAQTYIKAIIRIVNAESYNEIFYSDVLRNLIETQNRLKKLIEENINPVLNSFKEWEEFLNKLIKLEEKEKQLMDNPFNNTKLEKTDLFGQYYNIKSICLKIIEKINKNIGFINEYKKNHKEDPKYFIFVTEEKLEDGLLLNEKELKEKNFFYDSSFNYVYIFSEGIKEGQLKPNISWKDLILGFLKYIGGGIQKFFDKVVKKLTNNKLSLLNENIEVSDDNIFGSLFQAFIRKLGLKGKEIDYDGGVRIKITESNNNCEIKDKLFNDIFEYIDIKYKEKIKELENIKFLFFIDQYFDEEIWTEKIKKIFLENISEIYKKKLEEKNKNNDFKAGEEQIKNYNEIFDSYLEKCIIEIKKLLLKKVYDRNTGLNCLEHLIKNLNPDAITEDIANKTVQKMLEFKLISKEGKINEKLFKDCMIVKMKNKEEKIKQNVNININVDNEKNNNISNLENFIINDIEIPKVEASFYDLSEVYKNKKYNNLNIDYTLYIIKNFKLIIKELLLCEKDFCDNFYEIVLESIKFRIEKILLKKNFNKFNKINIEISTELSPEDKKKFSDILGEAREETLNLLKKG